MMKLRSICLYISLAAATLITTTYLWSCGSTADASTTSSVTELTEPLDSIFGNLFPEKRAPGAVVMVRRGDSIYYNRGFGMARLDSNLRMTDSTILNIASASKTFTAIGLVKLAAQGRLSLDDPMSKYFPEFNHGIFSKITLRHILSHTTGLGDGRPRTTAEWDAFLRRHRSAFAKAPDFVRYGREKEQINIYHSLDSMHSEPGAKFEYADAPYKLLAPIIEQVTDTTFEDWMKTNILRPAGMCETRYVSPTLTHPRMAHAYRAAKDKPKPGVFRSADGCWDEFDYGEAELFLTRADNGIYTSPREFAAWVRKLHRGEIMPMPMVRELHTTVVETGIPDIGYAMGIFTQSSGLYPYKVFHSSQNGGFGIYEAYFPDSDISYLIFANRNDWNRLEVSSKVDSVLAAKHWFDR
ncbi:MAG: beta-lactamase family protein [Muribaculaceae bacterium]|nr:beta-lactamase family protein [Muribaculaceae bacterium]